jgi:hypothetical protein
MNTLARTGIVALMVGVSLLLVTVSSRSSITTMTFETTVSPGQQSTWMPQLCTSRTIRMDVYSDAEVELCILDQHGIDAWAGEGVIEPVYSYQIKQGTINFQLNGRGEFTFLINNTSDQDASITVGMTVYGFESDLLAASAVLTALGGAAAVLGRVLNKKAEEFE